MPPASHPPGAGRLRLPTPRLALALLALWLLLAFAVAPGLLGLLHAGRGPDALVALLGGRDQVPLERYLGWWRGWAARATAVLALTLLVATSVRLRTATAGRLWSRLPGREPRLPVLTALAVGGLVGGAAGLTEATVYLTRRHVLGIFANSLNPDYLWMAPWGLGVAFGVGTLAWMIGARLVGLRSLAAGTVLLATGTLGIWTVLRAFEAGIHDAALLVLALGLATKGVPALTAGSHLRRRRIARAALIVVTVVPAAVLVIRHPVADARARAAVDALPPPPADGVNVVLLVLDTTRRHNLGLHGYGRPTTPALERLAARATVFDHAMAPAPWTLPSHASMFTGQDTHALTAEWDVALDDRFPTLAERLGNAGWATGGFVANYGYTARGTGLERGFHVYRDFKIAFPEVMASSRLLKRLDPWMPWSRGVRFARRKTAHEVNDEALAFIDGRGRRPFFVFLNYIEAHTPYERYAPFFEELRVLPQEPIHHGDGSVVERTGTDREAVDRYDSGIASMDEAIGALVDALRSRDLLERTLIVVTSDHGEQHGERGLLEHEDSLYCPLLCVPLLVSLPGRVPEGARVSGAVSLQQIPATVLELLGLDQGAVAVGPSLSGSWGGAGAGDLVAWSQLNPSPYRDREGPIALGPMQSVAWRGWHYIRNGDGSEEVYDLVVDPWEAHRLPPDSVTLPVLRSAWAERSGSR